ncbi:MAG: LptF/LptG family permease [Saprospiraceae bacterium]
MLGLKKLDWYIIRKFLGTFFYTSLLFSLVSAAIDFSEKINAFIENKAPIKEILFSYYLHFIPHINGLLWPLFSLISVIFFTSRLAANSEFLAMLNAGIPFRRLLRPYLIGAAVIVAIHLFGTLYAIPEGNKTKQEFESNVINKNKDKGKTNDVHLLLDKSSIAYIKYYRKRDSIGTDLRIEHYNKDTLDKLIVARNIIWKGEPNHWRIDGYSIRTFHGLNESIILNDKGFIDTTLNLHPRDFVRYRNQKEMLTSSELYQYINDEKNRGLGALREFEIELFRRYADSFSIFLLTIMGVAVSSRKSRGGMGKNLAIGIIAGAVFIILGRFSIAFTNGQYIPAVLGVWLPNILFLFVTLWLISRAQK